jgi:hypothetical protein
MFTTDFSLYPEVQPCMSANTISAEFAQGKRKLTLCCVLKNRLTTFFWLNNTFQKGQAGKVL